MVRAEKGKSKPAEGRDSYLPFLLPKHKSFGKKTSGGWWWKGRKVAGVNLNLLWMPWSRRTKQKQHQPVLLKVVSHQY